MTKQTIDAPFFIFNPKSNLYGQELLKLSKVADKLAKEHQISVLVTAPYSDLNLIADNTENIIVTAQHMDGIDPGSGMGYVLPESLFNVGVRATFLNHAEHPMTLADLSKAVKKAEELDMLTIVCADSIVEAQAIAKLNPDIILCEPTDLIGTGQTSDDNYILKTNEAIKNVNSNILVMQAAGISDANDVYRVISLGADGTGATSGIIKADNSEKMLKNMILAVVEAADS